MALRVHLAQRAACDVVLRAARQPRRRARTADRPLSPARAGASGLDVASLERQRGDPMPEKKTIERAKRDKREGKAPTTQAGEFVREEIDHIREGQHGARSAAQAIAIGLSKARRAGVELRPPDKG